MNKNKRRNRRVRNSIARQLHEGRSGPYRLQVADHKKLKNRLRSNKKIEHAEELEQYERELSETIHERTVLPDLPE